MSETTENVKQAVGSLGRSPLFLAVCIFQTLSNLLGIGYSLWTATDPSVGVGSALFTVGFWLIYFACRANRPTLSTRGVTYLRVLYIITAALVAFSLALCLIALCISTTAPTHLYRSAWQALENSLPDGTMEEIFAGFQSFTQGTSWENFVRTVVTTVLVVCVVLLTVFFLLSLVILRTLKRIKQHFLGETTRQTVPTLLIVACYIAAGIDLLTAVGFAVFGKCSFDLLLYVVAAVTNALIGLVLSRYQREMAKTVSLLVK